MTDKLIFDLTAAGTLNDTDLYEIDDGTSSLKVTGAQIKAYVRLGLTIAAASISDSTTVGRSLVTAADAATARANIDAPAMATASTISAQWTFTGTALSVATNDSATLMLSGAYGGGWTLTDSAKSWTGYCDAFGVSFKLAYGTSGGGRITATAWYDSGGAYHGSSPVDPGASNFQVQGQSIAAIFRTGETTDTTAGIINALSSANGIARLTGAAPDLRGIDSKAGAVISVYFPNASTITHLAGTAAVGNKIHTNTGANIAIGAGSSVMFFKDTTSNVWRPIRG